MTSRRRPLRPPAALALGLSLAAVAAAAPAAATAAPAGSLTRVSFAATGVPVARGVDARPDVSADGRHVVFLSEEPLVRPDHNGTADVFVRDRLARTTVRVSTAVPGEAAAGGGSLAASISADGRHVAFLSASRNLVPGDRDDQPGVFVRDLQTGTTVAADVLPDGSQSRQGAQGTAAPVLSADGRFIVFTSADGDLAAPSRTDTAAVYVRDLVAGTTRRVGVPAGTRPGAWYHSDLSSDGRWVTFDTDVPLEAADTDGRVDAYLQDLATGRIERVSRPTGAYSDADVARNATVSADGRVVAFQGNRAPEPGAGSSFTADIYLLDRGTGTTRLVSRTVEGRLGRGDSDQSVVSDDGSVVVYLSDVPRLVPDDTNGRNDVFRYDVASDTTTRLSSPGPGGRSRGGSGVGGLTPDGGTVAFGTSSPLVRPDRNDVTDVYVWERVTPG